MGQWWSQSKSDQKPKPGDLIEISRGRYQHWAVYVGDDCVVHVTVPTGVPRAVSNSISDPGAVSNNLMSVPTEKAMVRKEKLQEVVGIDNWNINNNLDKKYEPRSARIIVKEALKLVGQMIDYCFINKNCEHFVNELRYRKAVSFQVKEKTAKAAEYVVVGAVTVAGVAIAVAVGPIVVAAAVAAAGAASALFRR